MPLKAAVDVIVRILQKVERRGIQVQQIIIIIIIIITICTLECKLHDHSVARIINSKIQTAHHS